MIAGGSGGQTVAPFDPTVTVTSTVTLVTGTVDGHDWHGRAAIKRRPSDNVLLLVYRSGTLHYSASSEMHLRFSDDDGATWTADDTTLDAVAVTGFPMQPPEGEINAGDAWMYVTPSGALVIHIWSVIGDDWPSTLNGTWQSRSEDGGETWSTPTQLDFGGGLNQDHTFSTDDDFVWNKVIYAAGRVYNLDNPTDSYCIFIKSTDDGETWEWVSNITTVEPTQEVGLEYVGNNRIVAIVRSLNNDETWSAVSDDLGETWDVTDVTATPVNISGRHRIYTRAHLMGLDGWWKDPVLYMVGFVNQDPGESISRRNCIWISPDRGVTWDGPHYVDSTVDDAGYGDMFYDGTNDRWVVVNYQGTQSAAALKQYDLTIELT